MKTQNKSTKSNRWHLSAEGFLLLPSALRPHLFERKFTKNARFLAILTLFQIVAASTIFGSLCSTPVSAASLTLTIPSSFSLNITPGANGVFSKSEPGNINVKTDNSSGYTLSIKAKNSDNSNSLINSNISSSGNNKLNSISESTTEDLFKSNSKFNNSWGYLPSKFNNADNTNFLPGPTIEDSVLETTEEANEIGTDYNITLGAKIDNTMSSGSYSNNFIFSALANTPKYDAIMQNWTGCAILPVDDNAIVNLLDTRDNNIYTVAKLKDGKCWMTQNLRIQDKEISSEDSAIEEGTFTIPASDLENFGTNQNTPYVYVDTENRDNGGYYSWYTATAGQSNMAINGSINSICPKGWHLPIKDDFSNLIANSNYDSDSIKAAPANFTTPGYVYNKKISNANSYGYYWSSGNYNNSTSSSDMFRVYSSTTNPSLSSISRYYGNSIRCIAGDIEIKDYSITYDLNGGSDGPSENPQTGKKIIDSSDIKLGSAPVRDGYKFLGWCTVNPGTSEVCSGKSYDSGAVYPLSDGADITLYAIWHKRGSGICNTTGIIMKDGNCWSASNVNTNRVVQANASALCSGVWHLPSTEEFATLILAYYPDAYRAVNQGYRHNFLADFNDRAIFANDWIAESISSNSILYWWASEIPYGSNRYTLKLNALDNITSATPIIYSSTLPNVRCISTP